MIFLSNMLSIGRTLTSQQLSAISYQPTAISQQLSAISQQLLFLKQKTASRRKRFVYEK
jgi:uncharacterized protein involved in exopolysaccharide biosynthesis